MSKFSYIYEDPTIASQVQDATPYGTYDNDLKRLYQNILHK